MSQGIAIMRKLNRRGVKALAVLSFMAFTSCAIAGSGAFHLFTPPPRDMPHARCSPRSGPRGRASHAAQDPAHLSTMCPSGDIHRRSQMVRHGTLTPRCAGSTPAACARGRVAPGQCETAIVMAHMEMTTLAENCTVGGKRLSVMVLRL